MNRPGRWHAVLAGLWGVLSFGPAQAGVSYQCVFTTECVAGSPCVPFDAMAAMLVDDGADWRLTLGDGTAVTFSPLGGAAQGTQHLITTQMDPDASAVALLSISAGGQAILSSHGNFPGLGAVTHLGTCLPGGG